MTFPNSLDKFIVLSYISAMAFEEFRRRSRPVTGQPVIGIQNRGTISFNQAAYNLMAAISPPVNANLSIKFLYDSDRKLVAFRPVAPDTADSYPVRKQPASESYIATGRAFFGYYGIDTKSGVKRYRVRTLEGGVVGFSLVEDEIGKEAS